MLGSGVQRGRGQRKRSEWSHQPKGQARATALAGGFVGSGRPRPRTPLTTTPPARPDRQAPRAPRAARLDSESAAPRKLLACGSRPFPWTARAEQLTPE